MDDIPSHENLRKLELDVTAQESVEKAAGLVHEEHGCLDILVCNSGVTCVGTLSP